MLNRLRDKRGAAMESAILFLLVIFLLCFLLTLVALGGHANTKLAEAKLENRLKLDEIADDFLAYVPTAAEPTMYPHGHGNYGTHVAPAVDENGVASTDTYILTVAPKDALRVDPEAASSAFADPAAVLLTVSVRVNADDTIDILAYRYGAMTATP